MSNMVIQHCAMLASEHEAQLKGLVTIPTNSEIKLLMVRKTCIYRQSPYFNIYNSFNLLPKHLKYLSNAPPYKQRNNFSAPVIFYDYFAFATFSHKTIFLVVKPLQPFLQKTSILNLHMHDPFLQMPHFSTILPLHPFYQMVLMFPAIDFSNFLLILSNCFLTLEHQPNYLSSRPKKFWITSYLRLICHLFFSK